MALINGKTVKNANGMCIYDFIVSSGYNAERIAIEINGNILPKKNFSNTIISASDKIEIVAFVGGG